MQIMPGLLQKMHEPAGASAPNAVFQQDRGARSPLLPPHPTIGCQRNTRAETIIAMPSGWPHSVATACSTSCPGCTGMQLSSCQPDRAAYGLRRHRKDA